ncbi:hypothetical protein CNMCM8927_007748 [Aspergillus lentulus]|uniref:Peptidase S33 tripeptidyl aminopeptidase-like C-terminal domain-containing protein n=1 Tax=Aspergillus lentulus TaxID=293939 RepID=A0AAN6BNU3_ASPLE|nr:hypothetical protein CNMCM6069_006551 [Aspergillus lentulus]KAF4175205.1 hypothetical protein CNMCM8060_007693 [Aspergillus lentulus]KAF4194513.1 hypothetical protein CNMCM8694_007430 [Aspergillus lentulus]KAF4204261.1 hypothetical protein CNMCM8927_007748 [Aspergillus lentulus]
MVNVWASVPLNYGVPSRGTTAIAYIKLAATDVTQNTQNLLINQGSPGEPGVELVLQGGSILAEALGWQHNIVGFDPLEYAAEIFGEACTENAGGPNGNASFISTPAVAQDLFTYVNAEQKLAGKPANESKISYLAVSYGTMLCATFASLYPDHVGEMGPSVRHIIGRLHGLLAKLKYNPLPIPSSDACDIPLMATYSDLKEYILIAMYAPLSTFPVLADVLAGLERGNTSAYVTAVTDGSIPANPCNNGSGKNTTTDANTLIKCVDEPFLWRSVAQQREWNPMQIFDAKPPKSAPLPGIAGARDLTLESVLTSTTLYSGNSKGLVPHLIVTAETDPMAPKRGAYKMSSVFPGSVVLTQASVGHTAIASLSPCYLNNVEMDLNGQLPAAYTTCQPDVLPFQGSASLYLGI